jgi:hypothetical protein
MTDLIFLPRVNLRRHGLNDFNEPRYRVIWAPSRTMTLKGMGKVKTFPMYSTMHHIDPVGNFWILEGWQSAASTCMTPEQWDRDPMYNTQEYPSRGLWTRAWTFDIQPTSGVVAKVISWIEAGRMRRPIENTLAIEADQASEEKQKWDTFDDRIRNRMIPWPAQDVVGSRFRKNSKTAGNMLTAEQAGLHTTGMKTRRSRVGYRVPLTLDGRVAKKTDPQRVVLS